MMVRRLTLAWLGLRSGIEEVVLGRVVAVLELLSSGVGAGGMGSPEENGFLDI